MKIRRATIKDMDSVQKLNKMLFDKEYKEYDKFLDLNWTYGKKGRKFFKESLTSKNSCVFVAIDNDKIVGYLSGEIEKGEEYRKLPKMAELSGLFVLDKYRSEGIGKKFYNEFVKWAKSKNVERIKVEAAPQNKRGVAFYEKMGFEGFTITLEGGI